MLSIFSVQGNSDYNYNEIAIHIYLKVKIKMTDNIECLRECGATGSLKHCW